MKDGVWNDDGLMEDTVLEQMKLAGTVEPDDDVDRLRVQ